MFRWINRFHIILTTHRKLGNGIRFKCLDCKDFDLCLNCENQIFHLHFNGSHIFAKVRDSRAIGGIYGRINED